MHSHGHRPAHLQPLPAAVRIGAAWKSTCRASRRWALTGVRQSSITRVFPQPLRGQGLLPHQRADGTANTRSTSCSLRSAQGARTGPSSVIMDLVINHDRQGRTARPEPSRVVQARGRRQLAFAARSTRPTRASSPSGAIWPRSTTTTRHHAARRLLRRVDGALCRLRHPRLSLRRAAYLVPAELYG